ncbi:MAG TPA: hypothetical protein VII72_15285 [Myxococcota bacterium]|jgi:hypothetical protein
MARVPSATGNQGSAADRAAFGEVRARLGQAFFTEKTKYPASDVFGPLLHAPRVALELLELGGALRNLGDGEASLPEDFVEFVAFVVFTHLHDEAVSRGQAFAYRRPMFNHLPRALKSGLRPETIQSLRNHDDGALLPEQRELAEFVRGVLTGSVDEQRWAKLQDRLGARRMIETASYALLNFFFCRLESALGLTDATEDELDTYSPAKDVAPC